MKKFLRILLAIVFVFVGTGCSADTETSFITVSAKEAIEIVDNGEVDVILDVRTPEEYKEGNIEGSILIPLQELEEKLANLDEDQTYLVYCRSGNRSQQASTILMNNGFTHVYNLDGGYPEWVANQ